MKILKFIIPLVALSFFISCSEDDNNDDNTPINEIENLIKVQNIENDSHTIEVYTQSGVLTQGYNEITIRIKDKTTNEFVENATVSWTPMMHMTEMSHSCPTSEVTKVAGKQTIYSGYIIFQMPENQDEGWDLTFNYSIGGTDYQAVASISVPMSPRQRVTTFMGADGVKYILALIAPQQPEVAINDMTVGLFKMENMMNFPVVENYTITLDPRMPGMGNHSSPNNEDLTYDDTTMLYNGKLSLTMTGYWKLNLKLLNANNELIKGEDVTETNESSSLYLELEF